VNRTVPPVRASEARWQTASEVLDLFIHGANVTARVTERYGSCVLRDLGWAVVESEMLRLHVCRRLSERLDGIEHGPGGSIDKLLMTWVEQSVGHAALKTVGSGDEEMFGAYMYSRAQSVMGGTSQIQKNIIAQRILGLGS